MPKVVTFGELMLRLSPPGFERFLQTPAFVATFGGGEANVAVCLAAFGLDSFYVTRLPKHEIVCFSMAILASRASRSFVASCHRRYCRMPLILRRRGEV